MGNKFCSSCCQPSRSDSIKLRKPLDKQLGFTHQDDGSVHLAVSKRDSTGSSPFTLIHQVTPSARISASLSLGSSQQQQGLNPGGNHDTSSFNPVGLSPISLVLKTSENQVKNFVSRIPPLGRSGSSEFKGVSETKVMNLYSKYKDPKEDAILSEGVEAFCQDLELRPDEFKVLVLAWKCNLEQMCRFTRSEFITGCRALRADSIRSLQLRLSEAAVEVMANKAHFRDLYQFTFRFGLVPGQRVLPIDMAVNLWKLVFCLNEPPILPKWIQFLEEHPEIKGLSKDTWNMFLNLVETVQGGDLSMYDDTEAWPSIFDDFVESENDKANQNVTNKSGFGTNIIE